MFVVGLTGGIASGKTFVSDCFGEMGIDVIDSDVIARQVVEPGSAGLKSLVEHFGYKIIDKGGLDRRVLREIIFNDKTERRNVEQMLHPLIHKIVKEKINDAKSLYCIYSSPLLLETKQDEIVDRIIVVDVEPKTQCERASRRDGQSREQVQKVIDSQMIRKERIARGDDIIVNSGTKDETRYQVRQLHLKYLGLAAIADKDS